MKNIICPRCSGHGKIQKYNHVEAGLCFECNGSGVKEVEDDVIDIIAEIRAERKNAKETEKEFDKLYDNLKSDIKNSKTWFWYIMPNASNNTSEEQLIRLKQYIEFKAECKNYISNHMELLDNLDKFNSTIVEIENKYLNSRD